MLSFNVVVLLVGLLAQVALGARLTNQFTIDGKEEIAVSNASDVDEGEVENEESDEDEGRPSKGRKTKKSRKGKVGLIVVDVQDCFTEDGVGLGNPRGNKAYKDNVNDFVEKVRAGGGAVVLLQDYHPENHISFGKVATKDPNWKWIDESFPQMYEGPLCQEAVDWDNKDWFGKDFKKSKFDLDPDKYLPMRGKCTNSTETVTQPLFPAHCVQGTAEVKHTSGLCEAAGGKSSGDTCEPGKNRDLKVVRKGMNPGIDSFGGIYDNRVVDNILKKDDEKTHWGLFQFFKKRKVKHVIHIGIADDFCVKTTAFAVADDLAKTKYGIESASVVPSLSYGIFQQLADRDEKTPASAELIQAYEEKGVAIETEEEALARLGGASGKSKSKRKSKTRGEGRAKSKSKRSKGKRK